MCMGKGIQFLSLCFNIWSQQSLFRLSGGGEDKFLRFLALEQHSYFQTLSFQTNSGKQSLASLNCDLENHEVQTLPRLENLWTVSGNWTVTVVFFACQWFEFMRLKWHFVCLFWLLFLMCRDRASFFIFDKQEYSCLFLISLLCVFVCFYLSASLLNAFKDHCNLLWLLKTHGSWGS